MWGKFIISIIGIILLSSLVSASTLVTSGRTYISNDCCCGNGGIGPLLPISTWDVIHNNGTYFYMWRLNNIIDYLGAAVINASTPSTFYAKTPSTYDGADIGNYDAAHAVCAANFVGSHMCSVDEILDTMAYKNVSSIAEWNETAWVLGGSPGYTANANDCKGLTSRTITDLGRFWDFDDTTVDGMGWMTNCAQKKKLACCRVW